MNSFRTHRPMHIDLSQPLVDREMYCGLSRTTRDILAVIENTHPRNDGSRFVSFDWIRLLARVRTSEIEDALKLLQKVDCLRYSLVIAEDLTYAVVVPDSMGCSAFADCFQRVIDEIEVTRQLVRVAIRSKYEAVPA